MTKYNNVNKKYLNLELDKLESVTKNDRAITFRLLSDIVNNANETDFPLKFLLTNRQIVSLCKSFANHLSDNIK